VRLFQPVILKSAALGKLTSACQIGHFVGGGTDANQIEFDFGEFSEAKKLDLEVSDKYRKAAAQPTRSRSIFAQHAIKAEEIEQDLRETDQAIGSPEVVEAFVSGAIVAARTAATSFPPQTPSHCYFLPPPPAISPSSASTASSRSS
jgi:hypothetical protein